jgi:hypothetical protein
MTFEQAANLRIGDRLHYTGRHKCVRTIGPRGGITTNITEVRVTGTVKLWKSDPSRIRVPVKYGLYESGAIEGWNLDDFHLASECTA